jgi:hypothetical protein
MVLKKEKDKNLEPSRRESSRRVSWHSNGCSSTGIPDILGSFPIQVTNIFSYILRRLLMEKVRSKLARELIGELVQDYMED